MSEPKIYKPSIYKGAGVYNIGAGGGGSDALEFEIDGVIYHFVIVAGLAISIEESQILNNDVSGEKIPGVDGVYYNYSQLNDLSSYLATNYKNIRLLLDGDIIAINNYLGENTSNYVRSLSGWSGTNGSDIFGVSCKPNGYLDASKQILDFGYASLLRGNNNHEWIQDNMATFSIATGDSITRSYYMQDKLLFMSKDF